MIDLYFCPTVREVEHATLGGFDVCCSHPELHVPMPDTEATCLVSKALSDAAGREFQLRRELAMIREYLETSDDDGIRTREHLLGMLDQAGVPSVVATELGKSHADFGWHVLSACPDEAACAIHGRNEPGDVGPEDLPKLTQEDAVEVMEDMAGDLYRAEDRLAFVREMCDLADCEQRPVTTEQVRAWTSYVGCANATPDGASLARSLAFAMDAMKPGAEPVLCHHENAARTTHTTVEAGWGRKTVHTISCPTCNARADSTEGEPVLAPMVLNANRCTGACTERHTFGPGCQMQPTTRGKAL